MAQQGGDTSLWWIAEAILLAISVMAFLMLVSVALIRLMNWIGLIADYNYLELDEAETSMLVLTCCVVMPLILVLVPRLRRRG